MKMMMMMNAARNWPPFTATQWQELEHQALIFKYMVSGVPIPPDLLYPLKPNLDSPPPPPSFSSRLFPHHQPMASWSCFQMGVGRKIDPEPGRCRRTDGKKWRCSKEAFPDSKYCERHMHRGRNRSRKPVELTSSAPPPPPIPSSFTTTTTRPPSFHHSLSSSSSSLTSDITHQHHHHPYYTSTTNTTTSNHPLQYPFLYPHSSSSRPPGIGFSSQNHNTHLVLDSSGSYSQPDKDYRFLQGMKDDNVDERTFFPEASKTLRSVPDSSLDDPWRFTPLRMSCSSSSSSSSSSSASSLTHPIKERNCSVLQNGYSQLQFLNFPDLSNNQQQQQQQQQQKEQEHQHCFVLGTDFKSTDHQRGVGKVEREEPRQPLRHFLDEWPPRSSTKDSLMSTTHLSISIPMPSPDFLARK